MMSVISICDIPRNRKYSGYIWMSNATAPIVLCNDIIPDDLANGTNPFIVTAELYCPSSKDSFHIQQVGGKTFCSHFEVLESDFEQQELKIYKFVGDKKLRFLEYWEEQADEACLGMQTLVFKRRVFVGFENYNAD